MSEARPAVTVVVPCYNLGAYLDAAVQSVLDQTRGDFEIVIVDDGSTDEATRHLLTSYLRPQTRILRTENRGLARARNLGIAEARGRYVCCLDADDLLAPSFLERTVAVLDGDPELAFASCWLTAFGELAYDWRPERAEFPELLVEDTVCTAALMRRDAILAVGGFDAAMPVAGYEDWDLAIGLVAAGRRGTIVREPLFRYRVRRGSMAWHCGEPANHARLMAYLVDKHAAAYRAHLPGVLTAIERRTLELESLRPAAGITGGAGAPSPREERLEQELAALLGSRSWRLTAPLRRATAAIAGPRGRPPRSPRLSVVVAAAGPLAELELRLGELRAQLGARDEVVLTVAEPDAPAAGVLERLRWPAVRVVASGAVGEAAARRLGFEAARGELVFALDLGQSPAAGFLEAAARALADDPALDFVAAGLEDADVSGHLWRAESLEPAGVLATTRWHAPVVRRRTLAALGGYDGTLGSIAAGDYDLVLRLALAGRRGRLLPGPGVRYHLARRADGRAHLPPVIDGVLARHREAFERHWRAAILGQENQRRRLQADTLDPTQAPAAAGAAAPAGAIDWGGLRRLSPVSDVWGLDRGSPVDRYYIDRFLERYRSDIRGRALEVKEPYYLRKFDGGVEQVEIVDLAADNPQATVVADLAEAGSLPAERYDCFVLTQTLHVIHDMAAVLRNAHRALRPGGTLLATLPCVSRIDYESGLDGDQWRVTAASARRLFAAAFPDGEVTVHAYGNVLACCSFLWGLAAEELTTAELDHLDPYFPLVVGVRAVKAGGAGRARPRPAAAPRAAILLYHSIAERAHDRWRLAIPPGRFAEQVAAIARSFRPIGLEELAARHAAGDLPPGAVAVTFDDGYRDNRTAALPILAAHGVPMTLFVSGDEAAEEGVFWWELLDALARRDGLDDDEVARLHARLRNASTAERRRLLLGAGDLGSNGFDLAALPRRLERAELAELAATPGIRLGAHGWSHAALGELTAAEQRREIERSVRGVAELAAAGAGAYEVRSFAYPFGGPFEARTVGILREAGITHACTVAGGPVEPESDRFALPRIEVGDWSGEELAGRLAEWLGAPRGDAG